jgi:fatty-acyl-CoA synthase
MTHAASPDLPPADDFVRLHAWSRPDHPALIDAELGRIVSYAELDMVAGRIAGWLAAEHDIGLSDRVAVVGRNSLEQVLLHLACVRIGAIFVPLNWRLSMVERDAVLADCAPRLLVLAEGAHPPPAGIACVAAGTLEELSRGHEPCRRAVPASLPTLMLYTSGSSGRPKGVPLSEANLHASGLNFAILGRVNADSVFLVDTPLFHVIGMVAGLRPTFMFGGTTVISAGFDPARTLARLADPALGVTHYFCVPQMAQMLREAPSFDPTRLGRLSAIFTGGAPNPESHIRAWLSDGVLMADGFGMTEAGTVMCMPLSAGAIAGRPGSVGLISPTIEARVVGEDGTDCRAGEAGELLLRGPNLFAGYWQRPDETAASFSSDGYFRTGDLVRRDSDGFFFVVGRKKEMFISGGENVYPGEIEAALSAHGDIAEAAVFSVPDPKWGEVGHAAIVLRAGSSADARAILAYCEQRLARYKLPREVHIVAALPRTGSGKIAKSELRALLGGRDDRGRFEMPS